MSDTKTFPVSSPTIKNQAGIIQARRHKVQTKYKGTKIQIHPWQHLVLTVKTVLKEIKCYTQIFIHREEPNILNSQEFRILFKPLQKKLRSGGRINLSKTRGEWGKTPEKDYR